MAGVRLKKKRGSLDLDGIVADYLAGVPTKTIAARYGCCLSYPSSLAMLRGIPRRGDRVDSIRATRSMPEMPDGFDDVEFLRQHAAGATSKQLRSRFSLDEVQIESLFERFAIRPNTEQPALAATGVVAEIKRLRGKGLFTTQIAAMLRVPYRLVSEVR